MTNKSDKAEVEQAKEAVEDRARLEEVIGTQRNQNKRILKLKRWLIFRET